MATTAPTIVNGVNVQELVDTIALIAQRPELAKFTFRARTDWKSGSRSETRIRSFYGAGAEDTSRARDHVLIGDEPAVLLGTDAGRNAVEAVLHALASCIAVGFVYNASARGITVSELAIEQEVDLDLRAFLGLTESVQTGYERIRFRFTVKADAPRETLEELCDYVQKTSPVLDIVRNPGARHDRDGVGRSAGRLPASAGGGRRRAPRKPRPILLADVPFPMEVHMDDGIEPEDDEPFDPQHEDVIRAKWCMDGAGTLAEAAERLRSFADELERLERQGWHLMGPIEDDYGFIHRP